MRGYLLQGIGITTKSRFLAFTIPSILFGLLHFANPEIDKLGNTFIFAYLIMGFFLGLITLMDEGLELALGMALRKQCCCCIISYCRLDSSAN